MQKFLHMAPLVTQPWAAPNKTETQKEWKKEKRSFGYLDGSSSSCPTNKRIYYHADNVNLLLHKFSAKYFCFDDKEPGQKTEKCQQQQPKRVPHALEIEHGKEKKKTIDSQMIHIRTFRWIHTQKPIYFVIHFWSTIICVLFFRSPKHPSLRL